MNPGSSAGHVYAPIWAHTWAMHTSVTSRAGVTRQGYTVGGAHRQSDSAKLSKNRFRWLQAATLNRKGEAFDLAAGTESRVSVSGSTFTVTAKGIQRDLQTPGPGLGNSFDTQIQIAGPPSLAQRPDRLRKQQAPCQSPSPPEPMA